MNSVNSSSQTNHQINDSDVAIIGMSGRFPGSSNIESFWNNLRDGIESIQVFSSEEVLASGVEPELLRQSNYVRAKAVVDSIDGFDANFFGFSPKEAEIIDPQHRLFLECAWEVLETAGYIPQNYNGEIAVFAGAGTSHYFLNNIYNKHHLLKFFSEYQLHLANDPEFLATRTAYKLNLTGPAIMVQSACSTSLVAVHLACQSLLSGECDLALAGGVTLKTTPKIGYLYQEGMVFSPDGHCRAFDAKAKGTVGSQGVAMVALKRATDAIEERDFIYAIIKGSAINNDGSCKVGYTAPSIDGQAKAIAEAQALSNIDAETITYIEAHGTGTELGDPIEIAALTQAFRQSTDKTGFCAIGSLKTNLGHLNHAAGVAGIIKTALALHHKQIPPSLHFETPNPKIDFANSPFYVNNQLAEWETYQIPRRAGVSSFGIGGTNAHVVLEEAPENLNDTTLPNKPQLLLISAKTDSALEQTTQNLAEYFRKHPNQSLLNVAYSLSMGRKAFEHRRILVCSTVSEAVDILSSSTQSLLADCPASAKPSVIFMFPGQGSQYVNMARDLYEHESVFRECVDRCAELLQLELNLDIRQIIYPNTEQIEKATQQLKQTAITQTALFTVEYSLAKLWQFWGINPQGLIGHSIGEYVAATLAGVFSLSDALSLVAARGKMMQQLPTGAMLSVPLAAEVVEPWLSAELSIAVINQASRCVVSGPKDAIAEFDLQLTAKGTEARYLHTSHAFHSAMMNPILEEFTQRVQAVRLNPPTIPFVSNVTGNWITASQAVDPNYWSQHLRATVQFSGGIERCLRQPEQILLEVGPGRTLSTFVKHHPNRIATQRFLTSIRHPKETGSDTAYLLKALGQLWLSGVKVDFRNVYAGQPYHRVPLPTYPFERQRYWVDSSSKSLPQDAVPKSRRRNDFADWFYVPSWKRSPLSKVKNQNHSKRILLFSDSQGLGEQLRKHFQGIGHTVIQVKVGSTFTQENENSFTCNPEQPESYEKLIKTLATQGDIPKSIIHCWSLSDFPEEDLKTVECLLECSFYSLLFLVQAYSKNGIADDVELLAISNQMQDVLGTENLRASTATLLGAIRTIPQEYPNWKCRSIDLMWSTRTNSPDVLLMTQLETELSSSVNDSIIAYRGKHRWVQTFEAVNIESNNPPLLRQQGVYLITGGLGGIGLSIARYLAQTVQAKLVLLSRSPLSLQQNDDKTRDKIRLIQDLENLGSEVLVLSADVADLEQMNQMTAQILEKFGHIHGVVHAAGLPAGGAIELKTKSQADEILRAKVHGTLVLNQVLRDVKLDWWVLCSSLTSVLGGFGQVDYCAANTFLDAFAHQNNMRTDWRTLAINWDAWQEVGMAATMIKQEKYLETKGGSKHHRFMGKLQTHQLGLTPTEGVEVFCGAFSVPSSQIIVSTQNFKERHSTNLKDIKEFDLQLDSTQKASLSTTNVSSYERPNLSASYQPPRNKTEQAIVQCWQEGLGIEQIGINDNFLELGGDSLIAMQILSNLRKILQTQISLNSFLSASNVAQLAASIEIELEPISNKDDVNSHSASLIKLREGNVSLQPLFLIHSAGGSIFMYRDLVTQINSAKTIFGLQPDFNNNIAIQTNIVEMATSYLDAVKSVQPSGPYFLAGHSFGGIVALEMAQQLKKQGEDIELLMVMDSSLKPNEKLELSNQTDLLAFLLDMGVKQKKYKPILQKLEPDEQLNYFLQHQNSAAEMLKNLDKTPLLNFLQIFKFNHQAMANYNSDFYSGRVVFLKAQDADAVTNPDSEQEWLKLTNNQVDIHTISGNHLTMLNCDNAIAIARILEQYLSN